MISVSSGDGVCRGGVLREVERERTMKDETGAAVGAEGADGAEGAAEGETSPCMLVGGGGAARRGRMIVRFFLRPPTSGAVSPVRSLSDPDADAAGAVTTRGRSDAAGTEAEEPPTRKRARRGDRLRRDGRRVTRAPAELEDVTPFVAAGEPSLSSHSKPFSSSPQSEPCSPWSDAVSDTTLCCGREGAGAECGTGSEHERGMGEGDTPASMPLLPDMLRAVTMRGTGWRWNGALEMLEIAEERAAAAAAPPP
jgi:hypothetical protein